LQSQLKKQLSEDMIYYSKRMGLFPEDTPQLLMSKKEYSKFFDADMNDMIDSNELGSCRRKFRMLFVDINKRIVYRKFEKRISDILMNGKIFPDRDIPMYGWGLPIYDCKSRTRESNL
jgi:hypothetical protein